MEYHNCPEHGKEICMNLANGQEHACMNSNGIFRGIWKEKEKQIVNA